MWKKISSRKIFEHPRITLIEDTIQLPDGGAVDYLTFEHTHDSVTVICVTDDRVLLQREYSYPPNKDLYQFPGGSMEHNETPKTSAHRELQEESGYEAHDIESLGWYYPNNRRSAQKMHVYLAKNVAPGMKKGGDREEFITSKWISINELDRMITRGKILNFSVLAAWALFKAKY